MGDELTAELSRGLTQVPDLEAARRIAEALRCNWGVASDAKLNLDEILETIGVEMILSDLGGAEGGPQGLLAPLRSGGFRIEVDPSPPEGWRGAPRQLREEVRHHRTRFILAHELAHTIFYRQDGGISERVAKDSEEQERFCDALASALLVPPAAARARVLRPESVVSLHRAYDVSIEVAARALLAAHGDGAGWVVVVPTDHEEPWVQWGAERCTEAIGPWQVLSRIVERVREGGAAAQGRLSWRSGHTSIARGLLLAERHQLVVTARAA